MIEPASLRLRLAAESDLETLGALYDELDGEISGVSLERLRTIFAKIRTYPDYRIYLAVDPAGTVVGTYALLIMDALGERCSPVGVVEDVVVTSSRRGEGIGRRMMEHAVAQCRDAGCYKLMLSSSLRREDAHRFYESLGFERHGYSFLIRI